MSEITWKYSTEEDIPKYTWGKFTVEWEESEELECGGKWNVMHDGKLVMSSPKALKYVLDDCEEFAKRLE